MTTNPKKTGLLLALGASMLLGCGEDAESEGADVLLEDAYSATGSLIVSQDAEGNFNTTIRGRIGVDDAAKANEVFTRATLADAYLALHPGVTAVPDNVRVLSDRMGAQRAAQLAQLTPEERLRKPSEAVQPKDSIGFYNTACQSFSGGFSGYTPEYCSYQYNWHSICTYSTVNVLDRSFGWNESPNAGVQTLSGMSWKPVLPAWTWQGTNWGGSYRNKYACVVLNGSAQGNIGVTDHNYWDDLHLVGVNE